MILDRLVLRKFRNYESLDLRFGPRLNLIVGPNGSGKTNLAEAIHYLSLARSWRAPDDAAVIKDGERLACIEADVLEGQLHRLARIEIEKGRKKGQVNQKPVRRLSDLLRVINVLLFSPSDAALFTGSPGERRSFVDVAISKQSPDYLAQISKYARLLKERNAALKEARPDLALIRVLSRQMSELVPVILAYRRMFFGTLNDVLGPVYDELSGQKNVCKAIYRPFIKGDGISPDDVEKAFEGALDGDLAHRSTSVGPHREDFSLLLNGKDISSHGSQGENRTAAIAIKIAPYFMADEEAKKPVAVLDDVTSELDAERQARLFGLLRKMGQVFVTATDLPDIEGASYIDVSANNATRRN